MFYYQVDTTFAWEALWEYTKGRPQDTLTPAFRTCLKTQPGFAVALRDQHIHRVHKSCRDHGCVCGCMFCVDALARVSTNTMERKGDAVVALQSRWRGYDTQCLILMLREDED